MVVFVTERGVGEMGSCPTLFNFCPDAMELEWFCLRAQLKRAEGVGLLTPEARDIFYLSCRSMN